MNFMDSAAQAGAHAGPAGDEAAALDAAAAAAQAEAAEAEAAEAEAAEALAAAAEAARITAALEAERFAQGGGFPGPPAGQPPVMQPPPGDPQQMQLGMPPMEQPPVEDAPVGALSAVRFMGTVTSFSTSTAWGSIACSELAQQYGKDIFFHLKDCGGATVSKGQKVSFLLEPRNANGKPQARQVQAALPSSDPAGLTRYTGTVTNFSLSSAWGFIACPELQPIFHKDIFFHVKDCGGAAVVEGQNVTFLLDEKANPSKPQARSIRIPGDEMALLQQALIGAGALPMNTAGGSPDGGGLVRYIGTVTNYSNTSAWGFILCPELRAFFGKDIFFHRTDCGGSLNVANGATVSFILDKSQPGKPQARSIRVPGEEPPPVQQGAFASPGGGAAQVTSSITDDYGNPRFTGQVTNYSTSSAWGFILCPELRSVFGKDIFFHRTDCAGASSLTNGCTVSFVLDQNEPTKPQGRQVRIEGGGLTATGAPTLSSLMNLGQAGPSSGHGGLMTEAGQFAGTIESFSQEGGFGFIDCPQLGEYGKPSKAIVFNLQDCIGMGGASGPPKPGRGATFLLGTASTGKQQAFQVAYTIDGSGDRPDVQKSEHLGANIQLDPKVLALAGVTSIEGLASESERMAKRMRMD